MRFFPSSAAKYLTPYSHANWIPEADLVMKEKEDGYYGRVEDKENGEAEPLQAPSQPQNLQRRIRQDRQWSCLAIIRGLTFFARLVSLLLQVPCGGS